MQFDKTAGVVHLLHVAYSLHVELVQGALKSCALQDFVNIELDRQRNQLIRVNQGQI